MLIREGVKKSEQLLEVTGHFVNFYLVQNLGFKTNGTVQRTTLTKSLLAAVKTEELNSTYTYACFCICMDEVRTLKLALFGYDISLILDER